MDRNGPIKRIFKLKENFCLGLTWSGAFTQFREGEQKIIIFNKL